MLAAAAAQAAPADLTRRCLQFGYDLGITGGVESMASFQQKVRPSARPLPPALPRRVDPLGGN